MADKIKLVQGDTRPYIRITLSDSDGNRVNVSDPTTTVRIYFRAVGTDTVLATITCTKPNGGADGVVRFSFPSGALNVEAGEYEGEIEIDFGLGDKQTIYTPLKFKVREQFA